MPSNKVWWHTDENGRRIGYMTPERFSAILSGFYSERYFVKMFSEDFGFAAPSIYRWIDGTVPIRKDVAMLVTMLPRYERRTKLPQLRHDWLPDERAKAPGRDSVPPD